MAVAVAALARDPGAPRLDPSPEPVVRLDEPSSGRILREDEVRAQLPADWREARLALRRWDDLAALKRPAGAIDPGRLVWLVVAGDSSAWRLRVYDAASGIRLTEDEGTGTPPG